MGAQELALSAENAGNHLLVRAAGAMDDFGIDAITALADDPLNTSRRIVLDLAEVTLLDSGGIYALVALQGRLLSLELRNPRPNVATMLKLVGLDVWVTSQSS
jgi:anti-anti-sigma regulatory factor